MRHKILHEIQITLIGCLFFLVVNKCSNGWIRFAFVFQNMVEIIPLLKKSVCSQGSQCHYEPKHDIMYQVHNYELTLISDFTQKPKFLKKKDKKGKFHEIKDKNILIKVLNHEGQKQQNKDNPYS
jgi:hypothetical protein